MARYCKTHDQYSSHECLLCVIAERDRLRRTCERHEAALDAWRDWDISAEPDNEATLLERARDLSDAAINHPENIDG